MPTPEVVEQRLSLIANALTTPKTIEELSTQFRIHEATINRAVQLLVTQGKVKEAPFRQGKKKLWVLVNTSDPNDPVVKIISRDGAWPVMSWVNLANPGFLSRITSVAGALAQAWRYVNYSTATGIDRALAGSMRPIECKAAVREALESVNNLKSVIEQLLLAPIWEEQLGEPTIQERLGNLNAEQIELAMRLATAFEGGRGR
jgi:hypothetical protein